MTRKVLQKCIDELNQADPKLDYVRGILETVIETLPVEVTAKSIESVNVAPIFTTTTPEIQDEGAMLDAMARANLSKVQNSIQQE